MMIDPCAPLVGTRPEKFYTPALLAERWHMHPESIRRLLRAKRLRSVLISRRRLVPVEAVLEYERAGEIGGGL